MREINREDTLNILSFCFYVSVLSFVYRHSQESERENFRL